MLRGRQRQNQAGRLRRGLRRRLRGAERAEGAGPSFKTATVAKTGLLTGPQPPYLRRQQQVEAPSGRSLADMVGTL